MVHVYSTKTVKDILPEHLEQIRAAGLTEEFYTYGLLNLGPNNISSIDRAAMAGSIITQWKLPLPPSRSIEYFVERCITGRSKLDYRISIEGEPGSGKSTSFLYVGARYGHFAAETEQTGNPKDFFSLKTCCLLEDAEGLTSMLDDCDKHQAIMIDDAGVAVGNKDTQSRKNKNIGAIMQTCRTKRLLLLWNAPMVKHIDLQVRELIFAKGYVFKSCHSEGFNIAKMNITQTGTDGKEWKSRFTFDKKKINYHLLFTPGIVGDSYTELLSTYEAYRDAAADALIHNKAIDEKLRNNPVDAAKEIFDRKMKKWFPLLIEMMETTKREAKKFKRSALLMHCPDLNDRDVVKMLALYNSGECKKWGFTI